MPRRAMSSQSVSDALASSPTVDPATHQIRIEVETAYLDEQSDPRERRYVFSYTITIRNEGNVPARLLTRHWVITDANGKVQEVRGEGVVGEQPHLKPGQGFRYSSGAVLETPVGAMQGSYQMLADDGAHFDAPIAPFTLAMPYVGLFWTGVLASIIGLILASAFPAIIVYAQELLPGKVGMVAGLFFGFAFGMGGIGAALLGELADITSIRFVYEVCAFLPALGLLTVFLPDLEGGRVRRAGAA